MNKYEKSMMFNLTIMKVGFVIILITNLLLPIYKDTYFQFSLFQGVAVCIWLYGLLTGLGYFNQNTPILAISILRIAEAGYYAILHLQRTNWIIFMIFIILDVIYLSFLLVDKANYRYETEEVDNSAD